ncbi:MAG: type II toxin-antitoxin system RelE/ParE family toxin [Chthoniobacteraceae bacterium]|jgi:plasmid stabilization system protein ParE
MSFVLKFVPESVAELECVTGDYEARAKGLGSRFRVEVESACAAIVQHPFLWRLRPGGYRRVNLPGFPYYVAFVIEEGLALIIAVAHASRHPDYFKDRIRS